MAWQRIGRVEGAALIEARQQLHVAIQVVAAVGFSYLPAEEDWSHTSVQWFPRKHALVGGFAHADYPFQVGLRLPDLTLLLLQGPHRIVVESLPLQGKTLEAAYAWLADVTAARGAHGTIVRPTHEMPDHPTAKGAAFKVPETTLAEMTAWYGDANFLLSPIAKAVPGASPVRCWPHHFDIATLITLDAGSDPEEARSIGIGLSPGDGSYPEPYWYVTPWPYPQDQPLPALAAAGTWHTEGWTGAVLPASAIVQEETAEDQMEQVWAFLNIAMGAARNLLSP